MYLGMYLRKIATYSVLLLYPLVSFAESPFEITQQRFSDEANDSRRFSPAPLTSLVHHNDAPEILSEADKQLYRDIFILQEQGKMKSANVKIKQVKNKLLMGHVTYQRYMHPTAYRSSYAELKKWLRHYADHPGARNIYKMGSRRGVKRNLVRPQSPKVPESLLKENTLDNRFVVSTPAKKKARWRTTEYRVYRSVYHHIRRERPSHALKLVKQNRKKMSGRAQALSLNQISKGYFLYGGLDKHVIKTAEMGIAVDKNNDAPELHWWLGLAEWREGNYLKAAHHFKLLATLDKNVSDDVASSAAFWASRAYTRKGFMDESLEMLEHASGYGFNFYGQLASEVLGYEIDYHWNKGVNQTHTQEEYDHFFGYKSAQRALALYQLGDVGRSSQEFRAIVRQLPSNIAVHYIKYMDDSDLASVAFAVGRKLHKQGVRVNSALYPVPQWQPQDGFKLDPALIFGFIRQESTFKPNALSVDGASGLMQLMPATARFISRKKLRQSKLFEPEYNMLLGQRYIQSLMKERYIKRNLLFTTVAYNGGPGNLLKWRKKMDYRDDPLLFMETIPSYESRHFASAVMLNYWIYGDRLGRDNETRQQMAQGNWPIYKSFDTSQIRESYAFKQDAY